MKGVVMKNEDFADGIYQILAAINYVSGGGYDVSTGIDYKNDIFETWSFWSHCDCTCTYEKREWDWDKTHPHADECYQSLIRDLGFGYSWDTGRGSEEQDKINNEAIDQACALLGIDPDAPGTHVHCTCGRQDRYVAWRESATHDGDCDLREYGFHHYASGLKVSWYKRVGRSTESSQGMKSLDWYKIVVECLESVRDASPNHE
ncbi:hypothetical protein SEA_LEEROYJENKINS_72 [Microbacterium phage LeeroyJenkins]|nr:hypothetical protein SEA_LEEROYJENKINS_72 [Microbacterium phage LeeroyJenkins]